jgi:hypothetical protein
MYLGQRDEWHEADQFDGDEYADSAVEAGRHERVQLGGKLELHDGECQQHVNGADCGEKSAFPTDSKTQGGLLSDHGAALARSPNMRRFKKRASDRR